VDVAGEALSALAIVKLPFTVPSDPVYQARCEQFQRPFDQYAVPQAALRFKQGFGRLTRTTAARCVLLVLDRRTGATRHDVFRNLGAYLRPGDLLVMNDSRVRPARVWAVKPSGGRLELLILRPTADGDWETLIKPGRRAPVSIPLGMARFQPSFLAHSRGAPHLSHHQLLLRASDRIVPHRAPALWPGQSGKRKPLARMS